jgi:hypothetical protein
MRPKPLAVAFCGLLALSATACEETVRDRVAKHEEDQALWLQDVLAAEVRISEKEAAVPKLSRLLEQAASVPGVEQVALVDVLPGAISQWHQIKIQPEGSPAHMQPAGYLQAVSPGYFETMDLRLVVGRLFSESDGVSGPPVVIVNELYARMFPGHEKAGDVLGKRVKITWHPGPWMTIVGVVQNGPRNQSSPEVYVPYRQNAVHGPYWEVRAGEPSWYLLARATGEQRETVAAPLQRALGLEFRTLEERLKAYLEVYEPK